VILVKYYPAIGRGYDSWSGVASYFGTTLNKNTLGVLCLLSGLYFLWDSLRRLSDWRDRPTRRILLLNVFFISMTLWLLNLANSSTSTVCLILGSTIICVGYLRSFQRNPTVVAVAVPVLLISYVLLDSFFEIRAAVTGMVGRDPTFTTRTDLWHYLDSMKTNWLLGAGYESFWLGPRLQQIWAVFSYLPNQAHNGYREIYLNLGMVGLSMLVIFLLASYRLIFRAIRTTPGAALLSLALWSGIILYNVTEAAFKNNHALWLCFLVCNLNLRFLDRQARAEVFKPKPSKLRFAVAPSLNQPPSPLTQNGRRSLGLLRPPLRRV
jgi:O-antigen ligase